MIDVNYLAILVCAIVGMAIGALWHSKFLFGTMFIRASGMDMNMSPEKMAAMKREMWKYYLAQFVLLLVELYVLAHFVAMDMTLMGIFGAGAGMQTAFWIWLGFAMPMAAGAALWSNRPRAMAWKLFFINAAYQLVCLLIFGAILGAWMS